jgi:signal transduction histidine kinase
MSLTTRLSAFFLLALALVLAGFSGSLYLLARAYLHRQVDDRLSAALDTLSAAAEKEPVGLVWEPREHHLTLGQDGGPEQVRWEVLDERGRLVDRSANLGGKELWQARPPGSLETPAGRCRIDRDGERWQLVWRTLREDTDVPAAPAPQTLGQGIPPEGHPALELLVGVSLQPMRATLGRLGLALAGLSLGLWLTAAVVGRSLCRRALAPLTRMAADARIMDATAPGQFLAPPGTGDELEALRGAFNDLLSRLREAFERQRRFTGDASHQLRTPLTIMLGQMEVALRRERPAGEYRQVLSLAHDQAAHLRRIIEALLFLARADADADLGKLEVIDLALLAAQSVQRWAGHERQANLQVVHADGPLPIRAQPLLLGQLLDNLIENALKYSAPGKPVVVTLKREPDAAVLVVQDAGPGIAAEDLPHVFEPFYRSADARGRGHTGVGLGLAVVRRIATALRGTVAVESEPGHGSRFTVRIPLASSEA